MFTNVNNVNRRNFIMSESKTYSIRADEETINKFKSFTEQFPNGAEALKALISTQEMSQAKGILPGQETNINDFQSHADSLVRAYINALDLVSNTEIVERLESKDKTIIELQTQLADIKQSNEQAILTAKETEQRYIEQEQNTINQINDLTLQLTQLEKEKATAELSAQTSLKAQQSQEEVILTLKNKIQDLENAEKENKSLKKQLEEERTRANKKEEELKQEQANTKLLTEHFALEKEKGILEERNKATEQIQKSMQETKKLYEEISKLKDEIYNLKSAENQKTKKSKE